MNNYTYFCFKFLPDLAVILPHYMCSLGVTIPPPQAA